mmetsp:Transcript_65685/g.177417  ORF Transcript_65685/g.177417 Transcript_65685/m.177417 type:complete len:127 (+) Transcript_65685:1155-1535(+)
MNSCPCPLVLALSPVSNTEGIGRAASGPRGGEHAGGSPLALWLVLDLEPRSVVLEVIDLDSVCVGDLDSALVVDLWKDGSLGLAARPRTCSLVLAESVGYPSSAAPSGGVRGDAAAVLDIFAYSPK